MPALQILGILFEFQQKVAAIMQRVGLLRKTPGWKTLKSTLEELRLLSRTITTINRKITSSLTTKSPYLVPGFLALKALTHSDKSATPYSQLLSHLKNRTSRQQLTRIIREQRNIADKGNQSILADAFPMNKKGDLVLHDTLRDLRVLDSRFRALDRRFFTVGGKWAPQDAVEMFNALRYKWIDKALTDIVTSAEIKELLLSTEDGMLRFGKKSGIDPDSGKLVKPLTIKSGERTIKVTNIQELADLTGSDVVRALAELPLSAPIGQVLMMAKNDTVTALASLRKGFKDAGIDERVAQIVEDEINDKVKKIETELQATLRENIARGDLPIWHAAVPERKGARAFDVGTILGVSRSIEAGGEILRGKTLRRVYATTRDPLIYLPKSVIEANSLATFKEVSRQFVVPYAKTFKEANDEFISYRATGLIPADTTFENFLAQRYVPYFRRQGFSQTVPHH